MTAITEADRAPHSPFDVQPDLRVVPLRCPTLPPATHTNCVIVGRTDVVVIDPASPYEDEQERLRDWLDTNGLRLRAILLTHQHPDHVGGVNALREALDVPVLAHPATTAALEGEVRVDEALFEGDLVSEAIEADLDVPLRVLHTPGHARGHLAFRDERTGALVAGDLVAGQGTIVIDPPDGDMADYLATLARLVVLGTSVIIPAHGAAIAAGEDKLLEYIGHRQMREEQLVNTLSARPERSGRPIDLVPTILDLVGIAPAEFLPPGRIFDGISVRPVLEGTTGLRRPTALPFKNDGWQALIHHDHKIVKPKGSDIWELYDVESDPYETTQLQDVETAKFAELLLVNCFLRPGFLEAEGPGKVGVQSRIGLYN